MGLKIEIFDFFLFTCGFFAIDVDGIVTGAVSVHRSNKTRK